LSTVVTAEEAAPSDLKKVNAEGKVSETPPESPQQQEDASITAALRALQELALPQEQMAKFQASWDSRANHTAAGLVHALWLLAFKAGSGGDKTEQLTWERTALTAAQAAGLTKSAGLACQRVAITYLHLSRPKDAARQYEQCVELAAGTPYEASTYQGLAGAYEQLGRYKKARRCYEQAMRLKEAGEHGKLSVVGGWASGLAQKFAKKGHVWHADTLYISAFCCFTSERGKANLPMPNRSERRVRGCGQRS
jgi:tetratricopeptide (TPR) repeat protein